MADVPDDSVGRTWQKMTDARTERAPRPVVRRWLIPATAALAIGVIALSATLFLRGGSGSEFQPSESASALDTSQALAQLIAASAQAGPAQVPTADQVVHVRVDGWAGSLAPDGTGRMEQQIREFWLDPQGLIALQITDGTSSMMDGPKADKEGNIAQERAALASEGPNFTHPTPEWLAGLPTDPAALYTLLQNTAQANDKWTQSHVIWNTMSGFYTNGDLQLSPSARAALFGAYAHLGLRAETLVIGGRTLIGLVHQENGSGDEVLFDPATGKAVGVRTHYTGELTLTPAEGQPLIDAGVVYQAFFQQDLAARSQIP
jgi:hypothetical protein